MGIESLTAVVIVLGLLLLLAIIGGVLIILFILNKLREHEHEIQELTKVKSMALSNKSLSLNDSAVELNEEEDKHGKWNRKLSQTGACLTQRQTSLIVKSEACRLYGERPPIGQIIMTAQKYYKATTNTNTDIQTEDVQVYAERSTSANAENTHANMTRSRERAREVNQDIERQGRRRTVVSNVFTADWREGLPTSLLLAGDANSFEDAISFNQGVFVHKTIGIKGGNLSVSGVSLIIPPNALNKDVLISLGISWDERYAPTLTRKKALLSPVVLCQPSGITFKVPVTLQFPHAAVNVTKDWNTTVIKREGSLAEPRDWESISLTDYDERQINDTHVRLNLFHFTLYALVGESLKGKCAAKAVHIVAFTGKLQKDEFFKPRLFCLNKYADELEEVEKLNKKIDVTSKMADTSSLFIRDNGNDITVEVIQLSDDWNLSTERTDVLPFEQVWHSLHPHCTFIMKQKKTYVREILCEFHAYQNGAENSMAKLRIAEQIKLSSSPLSSPDDDPKECLIRTLVILLDPLNSVGTDSGDWRDLAAKMGCEVARIRWLGTQSSPTRVLLDKWMEDHGNQLDGLEQLMKDINRPDATAEVRNAQNKLHTDSANV